MLGSVGEAFYIAGMTCPICRKPAVRAHTPFCSKRCADVDLGRWMGGDYAIPGEPADVADMVPAAGNRDNGEFEG